MTLECRLQVLRPRSLRRRVEHLHLLRLRGDPAVQAGQLQCVRASMARAARLWLPLASSALSFAAELSPPTPSRPQLQALYRVGLPAEHLRLRPGHRPILPPHRTLRAQGVRALARCNRHAAHAAQGGRRHPRRQGALLHGLRHPGSFWLLLVASGCFWLLLVISGCL